MSSDAFHVTAPPENGEGAALAIRRALRSGSIAPEEVGYVNAHGTSTPVGDVAETRAIRSVFGGHAEKLAVSSTKSMLGHALGGSAAIEAGSGGVAPRGHGVPPPLKPTPPHPPSEPRHQSAGRGEKEVG